MDVFDITFTSMDYGEPRDYDDPDSFLDGYFYVSSWLGEIVEVPECTLDELREILG